jgi:hypothetical protein
MNSTLEAYTSKEELDKVMTMDNFFEMFPCYKDGDIIISYDFSTDELSNEGENGTYSNSEDDKWCKWYHDQLWSYVDHYMSDIGFNNMVDEHDGSGGGLY